MQTTKLETEILNQVKRLNGDQKTNVLEYLEHLQKERHSTRLYRSKGLKQIREALRDL